MTDSKRAEYFKIATDTFWKQLFQEKFIDPAFQKEAQTLEQDQEAFQALLSQASSQDTNVSAEPQHESLADLLRKQNQ
jgi:hypothetical protein